MLSGQKLKDTTNIKYFWEGCHLALVTLFHTCLISSGFRKKTSYALNSGTMVTSTLTSYHLSTIKFGQMTP